MRYSGLQITFQEIPTQISLSLHISGCPLACPGCHSADLWNKRIGNELTTQHFQQLLQQYKGYISCILFMGGEWHLNKLIELLKFSKSMNLKTALFTGYELDQVPAELISHLDYIKVGPYKARLGGLDSPRTNQRLIDLKNNQIITRYEREVRYETYPSRTGEK